MHRRNICILVLIMLICIGSGGTALAEPLARSDDGLPNPRNISSGWHKYDQYWHFNYYGIWMDEWAYIDKGWYYFNPATTRMLTGWQHIGESWYYLGGDGRMRTGRHYLSWEGKKDWYTFDVLGRCQ